MSVEPKYCIECAHSYADPGDTTEFLKCRNPQYGERDLVTGGIKWPLYWCSVLRGAEKFCGRAGRGWTLAPMDDPPPPNVPRPTIWQRLWSRP